MRKLTKEEELELLNWIESFELSRPSRRLSRDFADAVLLAEILKAIFPKWVDIHNYPSHNSVHLKLDNWMTLNRKVLRRLKIDLDFGVMQSLSQADLDTIEGVLYEVMKKSQATLEAKANKSNTSQNCNSTGDIMTVSFERQKGDKVEMVQQQMILYSMYQELEQILTDKNQVILILSQKNEHLENLIKLKDQRIADLEAKIEKMEKKSVNDWLSID